MNKLQEMKALVELINKHNHNYYDLDAPTISDAEYDKLYYQLVDMETELGTVLPSWRTLSARGQVNSRSATSEHYTKLSALN